MKLATGVDTLVRDLDAFHLLKVKETRTVGECMQRFDT